MGSIKSIFSPVIFFFAQLIFVSLMTLGSEMADPFGFDEVDFPLNGWLQEFCETVETVVEQEYPGASGGWCKQLRQQEQLPYHQEVYMDLFRKDAEPGPYTGRLP